MFNEQPNLSLPTVVSIPEYEIQRAIYMDAFRAGYKLQLTAPGHNPDSVFSQILKTEIAIRRDGTSNEDLHNFCLFSVNGFLHQTDYDDKYLYVIDGGKSLHKSRSNTCGITSFERIGRVHKKQLTSEDLSLVEPNTPLASQVLIRVPPEFVGKSIMLSIGGYLVTPQDNALIRVADDLWILNTEALDLLGRYFESRKYLDFTSLLLTKFPKDMDKVSITEFNSNEVIGRYLTLPQSFIIAVETDRIIAAKSFVRHSSIASQYLVYTNPVSPLFLGRGRQADYWKQQDEGVWNITVENGYRARLTKETLDAGSHSIDSGSNTPYRTHENSRAFLLDIYSQKLIA